jgi:hypothetical protein
MRYLFSFLSIVVKKRWFEEILISYLMVEHTHEKVDRDLFATANAHKNQYFIRILYFGTEKNSWRGI